jgi:hypothetical protein
MSRELSITPIPYPTARAQRGEQPPAPAGGAIPYPTARAQRGEQAPAPAGGAIPYPTARAQRGEQPPAPAGGVIPQQHVFYLGTDNAIHHIWLDAPSRQLWHDNWSQRSGAPPALGSPASMVWPNQQHVFYRGTDGINHIFWDAPSNTLPHDNWSQRFGATPTGEPAPMVWPIQQPNQQHIFYRGIRDFQIHHVLWDAASNQLWHDNWTQQSGAPYAFGDPTTMVWPSGQQHVFYVGGAGEIDHIWWDAPSNTLSHDNWTQRFGPDATPVVEGRQVPMVWPNQQPNQQLIFYKGTDHAIHRIFWDAPSNTLSHGNWSQQSGAPPATGDDPTAMVWANQQHIFYRGNDGEGDAIHHIFWDPPSNTLWHDNWSQQFGPDATPASDPASMVWENQAHIFYRGTDFAIHHIWWDAPTNALWHDNWSHVIGSDAKPAVGDPTTMVYNLTV